MSFRSARGRTICRIGSIVALTAFFLPWVSGPPALSLGYNLSGTIGQADLNGGELFELLLHGQRLLFGGTETTPGGPELGCSLLLVVLGLIISLGISFYKSRTPAIERKIAAAVLCTGILVAFIVVIVCAVYGANFKPLTFGDTQIGQFSIRYGLICSLLGDIAIAIAGYTMLEFAKANSAAPPESPEASAGITALDLDRR
jgi:hypothetical protein